MARILIIDDEPVVVQMLQRFLERNGFDVSSANDGAVGMDLQRRSPVDLVITDILMPGKEGFETIREMRRMSPGIKIVAISGGGRNEPQTYLRFATTFGADRAFAKPLDLGRLLTTVNELLGVAGPEPKPTAPKLGPTGV
jgi:DNA-binding response OmpR family regulator